MADTPEEIKKHLKLYWKVGYVLLFCTVLTVGVTYIPVIGDNFQSWFGGIDFYAPQLREIDDL